MKTKMQTGKGPYVTKQQGNEKTQWSEGESEESKGSKRHTLREFEGPAVQLKQGRVSSEKGIFPWENLENVCL